MRLVYNVEPRTAYTEVEFRDSLQIDYFLIRNEHISFWDFLLLDAKKAVLLLAYWFLKKNKGFYYDKVKFSKGISSKRIEIDTQDYVRSLAIYVEEYYRYTGKRPKYLFMGQKEQVALREFIFKEYFRFGYASHNPYSREGFQGFITQVLDITIVISPFLKGMFLWSGDESI